MPCFDCSPPVRRPDDRLVEHRHRDVVDAFQRDVDLVERGLDGGPAPRDDDHAEDDERQPAPDDLTGSVGHVGAIAFAFQAPDFFGFQNRRKIAVTTRQNEPATTLTR